ncbi:Major Facilitator Superfamily protein [Rubripirellula tenax]|uniref:Major Facilitator Superfamily protein n=1 Tax=Rubripirellula tenax TaxID=2528015 RepID=A0A5C6FLX7_9BACT|nr:MFS transporter [Rubripirellula tenax]TWU60512.1 Major Facilitator Superfamily protein [Rubripirellula tenax]
MPRRRRLRTDLRASCADATAFGGMVGFGETYLVAFALAVGVSELMAGLVGSLPLVVGGLLQLVSPRLIRIIGSHKRWVVLCSSIQGLVFLPLMVAAYRGSISGISLLVIVSIYWGAGLAGGPAWNTWIGSVVPPSIRPRYFAFRTRASQVAVFVGVLAGGLGLQWASQNDRVLSTYAILFAIAGACRFLSVAMLTLQSEPTPIPANMQTIPLAKAFRLLRTQDSGKLLMYLAAVQVAAQIAGPYFTPFMFQKLGHSYGQYVTLISVAFLAKVISLPLWGRTAHRIGPRKLLWIGGIGITPMSAAWMISDSLTWIIVVQVASGVFWAAYELAFFLLFFDAIKVEERTSLLTMYNLINTVAFVSGALIGGAILSAMGTSYLGYGVLFCASSIGRGAALLLLSKVPDIQTGNDEIGLRTLSVRPNSATLDTPVVASLPDEPKHTEVH